METIFLAPLGMHDLVFWPVVVFICLLGIAGFVVYRMLASIAEAFINVGLMVVGITHHDLTRRQKLSNAFRRLLRKPVKYVEYEKTHMWP